MPYQNSLVDTLNDRITQFINAFKTLEEKNKELDKEIDELKKQCEAKDVTIKQLQEDLIRRDKADEEIAHRIEEVLNR
jgi:SMC interacting uncharacterized protein involved in chromosome segregation